jgi:mannan endo-1,4-beta-mannosidase
MKKIRRKKTLISTGSYCAPVKMLLITILLSYGSLAYAQSGLITRQGNTLYRNGSPYKFVGFNSFTLTGCGNPNEIYTDAQLNTYFSGLRPGSVTRTWAFSAQGINNIARAVNAAAAHGQMLILVFSDGVCHCGDLDGASAGQGSSKTAAWYQGGFRTNMKPWTTTVVNTFKNSPAIAFWEIINEPSNIAGTTALKAFLDEMAAHIKSLDPNHLVSTGTQPPWAYGGEANYQTLHSGPNIDIGSMHEYDYDYNNSRTIVSGHYAGSLNAMNNLNKPLFVGEMGAVANSSGCFSTFQQRADAMIQKFDAYVKNGGARGALVWQANTETSNNACNHNVKPSDPLFAMTRNYVLPGSGGGDTQAPSVPTGLTSTAITANSVALSWTASTDNVGVTGYEIFRNGTSIGTSSGTTFNATGLACNTAYSFTVRARDAVPNWSAQSAAISRTTSACPPTTTVNDAVTGTGQNQFEYVGTWSTSTGTGKYLNDDHHSNTTNAYYNFRFTGTQIQLYAAKASHHGIAAVSIDGGAEVDVDFYAAIRVENTLVWTSPTLTSASHTLRVRVKGTRNASSTGFVIVADRNVVTTSGASDTQAPSAPAGLTSTAITSTSVNLSWNASTDNVAVTGYEVFRNGVSVGTPSGTTFNATGLTCNTAYSFTVRARDAVPNWSAQSAAISRTTSACPTTTTVNDAVTGTGQNQFEYVGTWQTSTGTGKYLNDDHYSSTTNAYYNFRFSGTQIQIFASKASHHGIAAVSIDGGAEVDVDFYAATRADNILIWTSPVLTNASHTLKVRVKGTKNTSSTGFVIVADRIVVTSGGSGGSGARMDTSLPEETAVEEQSVDFATYPNPTTGLLSITLPEDFKDGTELKILNGTGYPVLRKTIKERAHTLDISNVPSGMYIIKAFNGKRILIQKLIKQ